MKCFSLCILVGCCIILLSVANSSAEKTEEIENFSLILNGIRRIRRLRESLYDTIGNIIKGSSSSKDKNLIIKPDKPSGESKKEKLVELKQSVEAIMGKLSKTNEFNDALKRYLTCDIKDRLSIQNSLPVILASNLNDADLLSVAVAQESIDNCDNSDLKKEMEDLLRKIPEIQSYAFEQFRQLVSINSNKVIHVTLRMILMLLQNVIFNVQSFLDVYCRIECANLAETIESVRAALEKQLIQFKEEIRNEQFIATITAFCRLPYQSSYCVMFKEYDGLIEQLTEQIKKCKRV